MHDSIPRRHFEGTSLPAWMDDRRICAYQEVVWCMGDVLEPRAQSEAQDGCTHLKERVDNCDAILSPKPYCWRCSFFLTNSDGRLGSIGLFWGRLLSPP